MSDRPDYSHLDTLLRRNRSGLDPAELHGGLCAHLVAAEQPAVTGWLDAMAVDLRELDTETREALDQLYLWTCEGLEDPEFGFRLYIPSDADSLARRTRALSGWSTGFLGGLGTAGLHNLEQLPGEAGEFVKDLTEIARADFDIDSTDEAEEKAFAELIEYARVGTLIVFETLRGPGETDRLH